MRHLPIFAPLAVALLSAPQGRATTIFNVTGTMGSVEADTAFTAAANLWSSILLDDVTVNIQIGSSAMASGILAAASTEFTNYTYAQLRNALINDATSSDDSVATAFLPSGTGVGMLLNRTTDNPNGSGSATPYLDDDGDANNTTARLANANARALGLLADNSDPDGNIEFNSTGGFTWDFDPSDGITAGAFDFVGIMAHEIGHMLGFISGVDVLDNNAGSFPDNAFTYRSVLDLYRYSILSQASSVPDWTADTREKYFSIDGGTTSLGTFARGINFGDGRQASHWEDNLGQGILDPTAAQGELLAISALDIRALDVIGWNTTATPEPASFALGLVGLVGILAARRRA